MLKTYEIEIWNDPKKNYLDKDKLVHWFKLNRLTFFFI